MFWYRILISAHSYVVTAPRGYFGCQNVFVNSQQSPLNHGSLHWPLPLEAACSCLDLPSYMVLGTVCCFLVEPPLTSDIFLVDLKHILSPERLPFSLCYFGSLGLTLFFAIGIRSTIGTLLASIIQVVALLSYVTAYFPGGMTTLRLGGQMAMRGAGNLLPI